MNNNSSYKSLLGTTDLEDISTLVVDEATIDNAYIQDKLFVDTIEEFTPNTGTTVEGVLIKDSLVDGVNIPSLNNQVQVIQADLDGFPDNLKNLTNSEVQQLENINSTTISDTQWGYIGNQDQSTTTTDHVSFDSVSADIITSSIDKPSGGSVLSFNNNDIFNVGNINGYSLSHFLRNSGSSSIVGRIPYFNNVNNVIDTDGQLTYSSGTLSTDILNANSSVDSPIVSISNELQTNKITAYSGSDINFNAKNITNLSNLTVLNNTLSEILQAGILLQTNSINTLNGSNITMNNKNLINVGTINSVDISTRGDLSGPASSVNNSIPTYDSTTGKLIKDTGFWTINSSNGALQTSFNCHISTSGGNITCNLLQSNEVTTPDLNCTGPTVMNSTLNVTGNTTLGNLNSNHINFGQNNLNYYDEYNQFFTLTGVSGSSSGNVKFIRIGKLITVQWDGWSFTGLGGAPANSNTTFPSQFDSPVGNIQYFVRVVVSGTSRAGFFRINSNQTFTIYSDVVTGGGSWPFGASCSINAGSCSYTLL